MALTDVGITSKPGKGGELRVKHVDEREPVMYRHKGERRLLKSSGATFYQLTNGSTVKHTTADTWICQLSTCSGVYVEGSDRHKGCEHTRVAMAERVARGGDTIDRAQREYEGITDIDAPTEGSP